MGEAMESKGLVCADREQVDCCICGNEFTVATGHRGAQVCDWCARDMKFVAEVLASNPGALGDLPEPIEAQVDAILADVARVTADDDEIYDCVSCGGCPVGSPDEMCSFCSLGVAGTPNPREDTREYLERALI